MSCNRHDKETEREIMKEQINELVKDIHETNKSAGWWNDTITGESLLDNPYVIGTKFMLVTTEVAEAVEGFRKNLMDDKLPQYKMVDVEIADAVIRLFDLAGALNVDLGKIIEKKREVNANRADHKVENRLKDGGKKF